ncbi:hypothetical protein BDZ89DRAFT_1139158 [Hymenopellis radicata]|nr:hypothetical protein BDZ89DRAFT_1139158 [Hymenopellis radicata]
MDAGTMIAKCGSEMIALAEMEAIEVWPANANILYAEFPVVVPWVSPYYAYADLIGDLAILLPSFLCGGQVLKKKENIFRRMSKKKGEPIPIPNIPTLVPSAPTATPNPKRHSCHLSVVAPYMPCTPSPTPNPK